MTPPKPSAAAMRVANAFSHEFRSDLWHISERNALASLIDAEFRPALEALEYLSHLRICGPRTREIQALEACVVTAHTALRKIKGE